MNFIISIDIELSKLWKENVWWQIARGDRNDGAKHGGSCGGMCACTYDLHGTIGDNYMCLVFPMPPCPACVAPLLKPICKFNWPSWARNWASVNSRSFLSAIFGPSDGPFHSGCFWVCRKWSQDCQNRKQKGNKTKKLVKLTRRANEYKLNVTCGTFRFSNKSAVWKISSSGNPYFFAKAWNRWTFSINWKLVPRSWIFFTDPGVILFANLHKTTPSFKMSS